MFKRLKISYLSTKGPAIAGPSNAMQGATIDTSLASPLSKPIWSMCNGRKGNIHPTPVRNKKTN